MNTPECGRKLNLEKICGIRDSDHRSDFVHITEVGGVAHHLWQIDKGKVTF